jgi:uncharacterized protein
LNEPRPGDLVRIHYRRPQGSTTLFRQRFVHRAGSCVITLMQQTPLKKPVEVAGRAVLEPGDAVVWFTFRDLWHDIGRFHVRGRHTGCYANILTPVTFRTPLEWQTTDLFLDVWMGADGTLVLLDEDELDAALLDGAVTDDEARRARTEAAALMRDARTGTWPPRLVHEWTLERALDALP